MKAEELMTGDWVLYEGKPIIVENVYNDCINYTPDIPYVQEEYFIEVNNIQPIPLTEEILERNGIKRNIYGNLCGEYFPEDEHGYFEISMEGTDIWWSINYEEYHILKLQYVHQLQHALKLCGIDKEIEL